MNPIVEFLQNIHGVIMPHETAEVIYNLCKSEKLTDDQALMVATLVGDIVLGSLKDSELLQEIESSLGVGRDVASSLTIKLSDVLPSIKTIINQPLQTGVAIPLRPTFALPPMMPQEQPESPMPKVQEEAEPAHEAPLILHKEEEVEPAKETPSYSTQRPAFYKPTFSEEYKRAVEAESAARVELGEETKKVQPQIGRTSGEPSRIVHYSEFRTPLSPFEGAQPVEPQEETPKEKPTQIHPNNVVDLKDLPLK